MSFVYAPSEVFEFRGSAKKITEALLRDRDTNWSAQSIQRMPITNLNAIDVYPVSLVGSPPTQFHNHTGHTSDGIQPSGHWQFTRTYTGWPLNQVKTNALDQVQDWKTKEQDDTFTFNVDGTDHVFQNDPRSRQFISGAVLQVTLGNVQALMANTAPPPFSMGWTVANNEMVTLDGDEMIGLGLASANNVSSLHMTATGHKDTIRTANTGQEIIDVLALLT